MTDQPAYPHQDGDVTVLGPEIFTSSDGKVICWKGENYVPQTDAQRAEAALTRVRAVATAIRDATAAGRNDWQIGQRDCALTILAALTEPDPGDDTTRIIVDRPFRTHRQHATDQPKES